MENFTNIINKWIYIRPKIYVVFHLIEVSDECTKSLKPSPPSSAGAFRTSAEHNKD